MPGTSGFSKKSVMKWIKDYVDSIGLNGGGYKLIPCRKLLSDF